MTLPSKRFALEAVPVAATLLFWTVASWLLALDPTTANAVRNAGVVMAALYVAVRGVALAPLVSPRSTPDVEAVLRENARVAVPPQAGGSSPRRRSTCSRNCGRTSALPAASFRQRSG